MPVIKSERLIGLAKMDVPEFAARLLRWSPDPSEHRIFCARLDRLNPSGASPPPFSGITNIEQDKVRAEGLGCFG